MYFWHRLKNWYYTRNLKNKNLHPCIEEYLHCFEEFDINKPISEIQFTVFDSETTGLDCKKGDRIVSLSAVRLKNGRIDLSDVFHELVNPNRDIPSRSVLVHEILPNMVDSKPGIENVLPDFIKFIGSSVLVAHHGWLDMGFLNKEMMRLYSLPIRNYMVDTAVLDKILQSKTTPYAVGMAGEYSSALNDMAKRYNVCVEELHSSFWDATITAQIFQQMIKSVQQHGVVTLKDFFKYVENKNRFKLTGSPV